MFGGRAQFRCNPKNVVLWAVVCITVIVIVNYALGPGDSLETTRDCLLDRISELSPAKLMISFDEVVEHCAMESRLDIRQYPQLGIDYVKTIPKEKLLKCAVLSYGEWQSLSPSTMSMLGATRCEYFHINYGSKKKSKKSKSKSKIAKLSPNVEEEFVNPLVRGGTVSKQVQKAMMIEQDQRDKDLERDERNRDQGQPAKDTDVESKEYAKAAEAVHYDADKGSKFSQKENPGYSASRYSNDDEEGGRRKSLVGRAKKDGTGNTRYSASGYASGAEEEDKRHSLMGKARRDEQMTRNKHIAHDAEDGGETNNDYPEKHKETASDGEDDQIEEVSRSKRSVNLGSLSRDGDAKDHHPSEMSKSNGATPRKAISYEIKTLILNTAKQRLVHQLLINVPNGIDILEQLMRDIMKGTVPFICQINIVIRRKTETEIELFTSLLQRLLDKSVLLPLSAHTSLEKSATRLFLVNTNDVCVKLYNFLEPVVVE